MDTEFNFFKNLQLDEKHHSNILKRLISSGGTHGKKHLFLELFLKTININNFQIEDLENAEVTTEKKAGKKGRVDLFINFPNHTILIENKITGATNQPNQLYRYWKNLIYPETHLTLTESEINEMDVEQKQKFFSDIYRSPLMNEKYKLVYLTYDKNTSNINESKTKPNNKTYNNDFSHLPPVLPMNVLKLNYHDHIIPWLNDCLKALINEKDGVLYMFIEQYKDYLVNHLKKNR